MMENRNINYSTANRKNRLVLQYIFSVTIIILAAGLRIWPLGALELRIPWVTFYPAVMAAALYGGFSTGLLATFLAIVVVNFWSPTGLPFIDDTGGWLGLGGFLVNGSLIALMSGAMHRAKAQATRARERAEAANKAKSVFLANMSHELRTPLNAILGFSNMLKKSPEATTDQVKKLGIISNSGENLLNLINNVLDISKIEAGHMAREDSDTNLEYLLREVESLMDFRVAEKGLNFQLELAAGLPVEIMVDQGKLRQVLTNLVANAVKYTKNGEINVRVKMKNSDSGGPALLHFEVQDTGTGIRPEETEKIFLPFEQVGDQPAKVAGTGLGLAICRQFVELMGGRIGVASEFGKGSTFYFEFPITVSEKSSEAPVPELNRQVVGMISGQKRFRILIAEDKLENRLLLQGILEPFNFDIREADNGQEALDQCCDWKPDLIFMDIRMPVMDGQEATRRIKNDPKLKDTRIVALTALALEDERLKILAAGCDDFIRKPYRDTEIHSALSKFLGVKFQYFEDVLSDIADVESHVKIEALVDCSNTLLVELQSAAELLDDQRCLLVIQKIGYENDELSACLSRMIKNVQYKELLEMLDLATSKELQ